LEVVTHDSETKLLVSLFYTSLERFHNTCALRLSRVYIIVFSSLPLINTPTVKICLTLKQRSLVVDHWRVLYNSN